MPRHVYLDALLALAALLAPLPARAAAAGPASHKAWLACRQDSDCTSVELGCWYWQPVAKAHADAMRAAYPPVCAQSVPAGPRPTSRCERGSCSNVLDVGYWERLGAEPGGSLRNGLVGGRLDACLKDGKTAMAGQDRAAAIDRYVGAVDRLVAAGTYRADAPLARVLASAVPCRGLVSEAKEKSRWRAVERRDGSSIRVTVESVSPGYPARELYPPLMRYKPVLARCVAADGPNSPWGELRVSFVIGADGSIPPSSFQGSFMAAHDMARFIDCVSVPFKRLVFPAPKAGRRVVVQALYQVPRRPVSRRASRAGRSSPKP